MKANFHQFDILFAMATLVLIVVASIAAVTWWVNK